MVDELYFFNGAHFILQAQPDLSFNFLYLKDNLFFVQVGILVTVNDQGALQKVKRPALVP
ncbi:hypothetical protein D3C86_1969800 [compost metagenome]